MAQQFEGVIKAEYYQGKTDSRSDITWYLAPGKIALNMVMSSQNGNYTATFIARQGSNELDVLSQTPDGKKLHHAIPASDISSPEHFPSYGSFEAQLQDETKNQAGYRTTKVVGESDESKTIAWVAKDIDFPFYQYADYFKSDYNIALLADIQMNGFPLQSVTTNNRGLIIESIEVEDVTERNLDPSVFKVPADYKTVEKSNIGVMGQ
jgi:hypothetical protein